MVCGSKNLTLWTNTCFGVSFQKNVFSSFFLFSSVCYQDDLSDCERIKIPSSTARNFNNSWLLYVKFSETTNLCKNICLIENWKCQLLLFLKKKSAKKDNIFNFLKRSFSVMHGPMGMVFGVFSETYVRLLTSVTSQFFLKYNKSYNNLNVKKCLKLNGP